MELTLGETGIDHRSKMDELRGAKRSINSFFTEARRLSVHREKPPCNLCTVGSDFVLSGQTLKKYCLKCFATIYF